MFGIIRPCRNRLGEELRSAWMAHLCGLCLALRDEHGHAARLVTNYDALIVSALVEAQTGSDGHRRQAGPCALRGLRGASVAEGDAARLAASVSLLLASAKLRDHLEDGDVTGVVRSRATTRVADRWAAAGEASGTALALDTGALLAAVAGQRAAERDPASLLDVTAATEAATALAFGHTAVLAGCPGNEAPLAEAGRLFGRLAHLLDAVEDLHADRASGAWNPIVALGLTPADVRRHCDDAALGIRLALRDATFVEPRLVHVLLAHEVDAAITRVFTTAGQPTPPLTPPLPPDQQPPGQRPPNWEAPPPAPGTRNPLRQCLGWLVVCGTCQVCCADEWTNPCNGRKHQGACSSCDSCCDCGGCCCDGCNCCDGCDCCDCSC